MLGLEKVCNYFSPNAYAAIPQKDVIRWLTSSRAQFKTQPAGIDGGLKTQILQRKFGFYEVHFPLGNVRPPEIPARWGYKI